MKFVELKKHIEENGACPIYFCEGEEAYFRDKAEFFLKSKFLQDATLDYAAFDGGSLKGPKLSSLVAAVNCFPFLSEKRFVKVTDFYPTEEEYDKYLTLYESAPANEKPDYSLYYSMLAFAERELAKLNEKIQNATDWEKVELEERIGGLKFAKECLNEAWQRRKEVIV